VQAAETPSSSHSPKVLEFYCGVGGLHYSLLRARPAATVVGAFDINPNSNDVYEHNFGARPFQKNLFGSRGWGCRHSRLSSWLHWVSSIEPVF
jgi:site-specific DNA-cytosine methylase